MTESMELDGEKKPRKKKSGRISEVNKKQHDFSYFKLAFIWRLFLLFLYGLLIDQTKSPPVAKENWWRQGNSTNPKKGKEKSVFKDIWGIHILILFSIFYNDNLLNFNISYKSVIHLNCHAFLYAFASNHRGYLSQMPRRYPSSIVAGVAPNR